MPTKKQLSALGLSLSIIATLAASYAEERRATRHVRVTEVRIRKPDGTERTEALVPGEWIHNVCESKLSAYVYQKGRELRFERKGHRLFVGIDGAPLRLAGITFARPEGEVALREGIARHVSPLTIRAWRGNLAALPPMPKDMAVALEVSGPDPSELAAFVARCPGLYALSVSGGPGTPKPELFARLTRLTSIRVSVSYPPFHGQDWGKLVAAMDKSVFHLAPLAGLTRLRSLRLWGVNASDLRPLAELRDLNSVYISPRYSPADLRPLGRLTELRKLTLAVSTKTTDLSPLAACIHLEQLELGGCKQVASIAPLGKLTRLTRLSLSGLGNQNVLDLAPLAKLTELTELDIGGFPKVRDIRPLSQLSHLTELRLAYFDSVNDLTPLAGLTNLRSLSLAHMRAVTDLAPVARLANLGVLELAGEPNGDLAPVAKLTKLRELSLSDSDGLTDIRFVAELKGLEELTLFGLRGLTDLSPIRHLTHLKVLRIEGCRGVVDLFPLARLRQLRSLKLTYCKNLEDLSPLDSLPRLAEVTVMACDQVTDLTPLRAMIKRGGTVRCHGALAEQVKRLRAHTDF